MYTWDLFGQPAELFVIQVDVIHVSIISGTKDEVGMSENRNELVMTNEERNSS